MTSKCYSKFYPNLSPCRGRYNQGQRIFAYNSPVAHSKTVYPQIPWMELNHFAIGHGHFQLESFFDKSQKLGKTTFSNSSLGFCPICVKLGTYTLQLDLISNYQKNFARSKNAQIINEPNLRSLVGCHETGKGWAEFGIFWPLGGAKIWKFIALEQLHRFLWNLIGMM